MKRYTVYPQFINSYEDFYNIKHNFVRDQKVYYKCTVCGMPTVRSMKRINEYPCLCRHCSYENEMLNHYGVINNFQRKEIKTKSQETLMKEYGVINSSQRKEHWDKVKETSLKQYGTEHPSQAKEVKEKQAKTNIIKYGNISSLQNGEVNNKTKNTMILRYGCEYSAQNKEIHSKQRKKYTYNGLNFDSSWEIAYFIWLTDNNIPFEYHPEPLKYYWNEKTHYYFPDFKVNNELIEIKGLNWLKKLLEKGTVQEAKYKCMQDNNVKLITDVTLYMEYIRDKFGTIKYLNKFKNNK